ncbi:DUF3467 domain-containing protein [Thermospira aquatica]|uniref:DUF3467 domain-containing protein n=1 Tax=Thermospira aquatica TaxID=2828656 RepID=A0AAX3BDM8_9SPIR|nr:DUF3467 domain-containing protein [Thermospira aquatica]URA10248.1 DUF3467 domain-containing protein [Thermospira aquatica]
MERHKSNNGQSLKINFTDRANGVSYSNFALINSSSEEFLFDFGSVTPGEKIMYLLPIFSHLESPPVKGGF